MSNCLFCLKCFFCQNPISGFICLEDKSYKSYAASARIIYLQRGKLDLCKASKQRSFTMHSPSIKYCTSFRVIKMVMRPARLVWLLWKMFPVASRHGATLLQWQFRQNFFFFFWQCTNYWGQFLKQLQGLIYSAALKNRRGKSLLIFTEANPSG